MKTFFLDTNIIFAYCLFKRSFPEGINLAIDPNILPAKEFIEEETEKNLCTCHFIKNKELPNLEKRRFIMIREIMKKLKDPSSQLEVNKQDQNWCLKIFNLQNFFGKEKLIEELLYWEIEIQTRHDIFIKKLDIVIPEDQIDEKLREIVEKTIDNRNDSIILTCAIQHNKVQKLTFTTADKDHFQKNTIEYLKSDPEIQQTKTEIPEVQLLGLADVIL